MCYVAWMFFSFSSPSAGVKYQRLRFTKELVVFIIALRPRRAGGRAGGDVTRNTNPETATVAFFVSLFRRRQSGTGRRRQVTMATRLQPRTPARLPSGIKTSTCCNTHASSSKGMFRSRWFFFFKKLYLITKLKRYTHDT